MESTTASHDTNGIESDKLKTASYDSKWEVLKPFIRRLYVEQELDVDKVAKALRVNYNFNAQQVTPINASCRASQYKYRFQKWGWKKNIPSRKKAKMCDIRQNRAKAGKQTSLEHEGKVVELKRLRRYLKETTRRDAAQKGLGDRGIGWKLITGSSFQPGSSVFLNWNLPYGTLRSLKLASNTASPATVSTPSDVIVATPSSNEINSPRNAPSPLTRAHNLREAVHRAQMFIEGRYHELLSSMTREDKITMSKWLYQYWLYSFKTAKHWGTGPRSWDASRLGFVNDATHCSISLADSPESFVEGSQVAESSARPARRVTKPSPLCHWSIHYQCEVMCDLPRSRTPTPDPDPDMYDEKSWKAWPESWKQPPYQDRLLRDLATNDFSSINAESLPIDVSQIVKVAEKSDRELNVEAIGFSIMARNAKLASDGLTKLIRAECSQVDLDAMNLFHLAAMYLDGAKSCCTVFEVLAGGDERECSLRTSTRNNLNHTIFDTLMMTILKSHSLAPPSIVDDNLRDEARFPGEEVDTCGRWDAGSDTYRSLVTGGYSHVPAAWKHKFCHTSVQAICHSIQLLEWYGQEIGDIFAVGGSTGLFVKHCMACGLKMQVSPLHTVVLITVALGTYGKEDEDLFGMIAVLLELLALGINPLESKEISILAHFPEAPELMDLSGCQHQRLNPAELASFVPQSIIEKWSDAKKTGWQLFKHILLMSELEWSEKEINMPIKGPCLRNYHRHYFGFNQELPLLYATTNAELLTYRRLKESDPWMSHNFDMQAIVHCLSEGDNLRDAIGFTRDDLIKEFCEDCGRFGTEWVMHCNAKDVMKSHFSNLEDWSRTTFITDRGLY